MSVEASVVSEAGGKVVPKSRAAAELFLISLILLFLELACIRWFPAHVIFLTFFTNTILLASFLGMSLGCLAARRPQNFLADTPVLLVIVMTAALWLEFINPALRAVLQVGNRTSPQVVFFGNDYQASNPTHFFIPIELVLGFFFFMVALAMVGPGQELGRALDRLPNRVEAYTWNILGSLAGIVLFAGFSSCHRFGGFWRLYSDSATSCSSPAPCVNPPRDGYSCSSGASLCWRPGRPVQ
jgi:hypothetical protein